jgi:hypothetical protein
VFFSHPADFTPVCTTEFMTFASMQPEFEKLNCKLLGLSIPEIQTRRQILLLHLYDSTDELPQVPSQQVRADYSRDVRIQV